MGERLAGGNVAIALLANTIATGATLAALIFAFGPISGAHFNPAVTLADALGGGIGWRLVPAYVIVQVAGGVAGVVAAHVMFSEPALQVSSHARAGGAMMFSEFVATFGLLAVIRACVAKRPDATPIAVALYITGAYWFTASTSFANPAVTIARSLSDTSRAFVRQTSAASSRRRSLAPWRPPRSSAGCCRENACRNAMRSPSPRQM